MATWFTADTHFGHARAIELCKRPFASVDMMDQVIIERWNFRVAAGDIVYHLGDFSFDDQTPYLDKLKGQKILIRGNHDHKNRVKKAVGWQAVYDLAHVKVDGKSVVLCHYAMRTWRNSHHGALHLYGHSHGNLEGDSQSCDVGVDVWGFEPISLKEAKYRMICFPKRVELDHHVSGNV